MQKRWTKENLEKLFGINFTEYETNMFNAMIAAYKNNKKLIIYPARAQSNHKLLDCFNVYICLSNGIRANNIIFDEIHEDENAFNEISKLLFPNEDLKKEVKK